MPTYEYECNKCGERFDVFQTFAEEPLKKHPGTCRGKVVKVMSPAGIVFSGSGFYKTDNRSGSKNGNGKNAGSKSDSSKSESGDSSGSTTSDGASKGSGSSSNDSGSSSKDSAGSSKAAPASTSNSSSSS